MISDVLATAIAQMNAYLWNPTYNSAYDRQQRIKIIQVREAMDKLRQELDTPPAHHEISA